MALRSTMVSKGSIAAVLTYALPAMAVISADCNNMVYRAAPDPTQQYGYNACNATTENQSSLCQTAFINSIEDYCIWGPATPISEAALNDNEAATVVAWCSRPGHGTRLIPPDSILGTRYVKTPHYVEVWGGFTSDFNESAINYMGDPRRTDLAGQFDPRGIDGRGSPPGGLVFSNGFSSNNGDPNNYTQAVEWDSMIGYNFFYMRACDPNVSGSAAYCARWDNQYYSWVYGALWTYGDKSLGGDYIGCLGDSRPLGLVEDLNGTTITYTGQPLPSRTLVPPAVSSCTTYSSQDLYGFTTISPGIHACGPAATSSATTSGTETSAPTHEASGVSKARVGAIVGSVIGGLVLIGALVALVILRRLRRNKKIANVEYSTDAIKPKEPFTPDRGSLPFTPDSATLAHSVTPLGYDSESTRPFSIPTISSSSSPLPRPESALPGYAAASRAPPFISPSLVEGSTTQSDDDELGRWAEENRSYIPRELERKLRAAHYLPSDNPDLLPANVWNDEYGVGHFELKRLQDLYARRPPRVKAVFNNSQGFINPRR